MLRGAFTKYAKSDAVYDVTLRDRDGRERAARVMIPWRPRPAEPPLRVERWDDEARP